MALELRDATTRHIKLRMGIQGPYKSGKTFTAMTIMEMLLKRLRGIGQLEGDGQWAVADTEKESARRYARRSDGSGFTFKHIRCGIGDANQLIEAIGLIGSNGLSGGILDSTSPEWGGRNGVVARQNEIVTERGSKAQFSSWADAKKPHHAFVDAMTDAPFHLIATIRSRVKHAQEGSSIVRLGMKPIQNEELPYEFDILGEMNHLHQLRIFGSRCPTVDNRVFDPIGAAGGLNPLTRFIELVADWLTDSGTATRGQEYREGVLDPASIGTILALVEKLGVPDTKWQAILANNYGVSRLEDLDPDKAKTLIRNLQAKLAAPPATATTAIPTVSPQPTIPTPSVTVTAATPPPATPPPAVAPAPSPAPAPAVVVASGPPIAQGLTDVQRDEIVEQILRCKAAMGMPDGAYVKALEKRGISVDPDDATDGYATATAALQDDELKAFLDKMVEQVNIRTGGARSTPQPATAPPAVAPSVGSLSPQDLEDAAVPKIASVAESVANDPTPATMATAAATQEGGKPKRTRKPKETPAA